MTYPGWKILNMQGSVLCPRVFSVWFLTNYSSFLFLMSRTREDSVPSSMIFRRLVHVFIDRSMFLIYTLWASLLVRFLLGLLCCNLSWSSLCVCHSQALRPSFSLQSINSWTTKNEWQPRWRIPTFANSWTSASTPVNSNSAAAGKYPC